MIYRRLFEWIDCDDACKVNEITIYSAHDPTHDEEQEFIIKRLKTLNMIGVTIKSIMLELSPHSDVTSRFTQLPSNYLNDIDELTRVIGEYYKNDNPIESMTITVSIKENY